MDKQSIPHASLDTPAVLVDMDKLETNILEAQRLATVGEIAALLRPGHGKDLIEIGYKYLESNQGGIMPVVVVEMWQGRTISQKRQLAKGITDHFVKIGVPKEQVHIIFKDNPKSNWATGGRLASEEP